MSKISQLAENRGDKGVSISGQGMDRAVARKTPITRKVAYGVGAVLAALFIYWLVGMLLGGRSLSVNSQRVFVSDVTVGTFEDFIPLRGRLVPRSTVYLDAIEGGRVEEVLIEDGALVNAGDPIARLSNTNLQLEVLGREAAFNEQVDGLRTCELLASCPQLGQLLFLKARIGRLALQRYLASIHEVVELVL